MEGLDPVVEGLEVAMAVVEMVPMVWGLEV